MIHDHQILDRLMIRIFQPHRDCRASGWNEHADLNKIKGGGKCVSESVEAFPFKLTTWKRRAEHDCQATRRPLELDAPLYTENIPAVACRFNGVTDKNHREEQFFFF